MGKYILYSSGRKVLGRQNISRKNIWWVTVGREKFWWININQKNNTMGKSQQEKVNVGKYVPTGMVGRKNQQKYLGCVESLQSHCIHTRFH